MTEHQMCRQCGIRPPSRKGRPYCSKSCSNRSRKRTVVERFRMYFVPGLPDACWPWAGPVDRDGYGILTSDGGQQLRAHRIAYESVHGHIPPGLQVLHWCDNPPCCNPAHLRPGTADDNNKDKARKGRAKSTLNAEQVREIRKRLAAGETQTAIAADYGVTAVCVFYIHHRKSWAHLSD